MKAEHVFAGIPVAHYQAARPWYERLLGRPPDLLPNDNEAAWQLTDSAWIYIVGDPQRAGSALVTILVDDLAGWIGDAPTDDSIPGIRRSEMTDPDGNRLVVAVQT